MPDNDHAVAAHCRFHYNAAIKLKGNPMINLYQRLNLPLTASRAEIEAALAQYHSELSDAEIRGVQEWLLVNEVRYRYDAKLRQEQPSFFIPSMQKQPAPAATSDRGRRGYYTPKLYNPTVAAVLGILLSPIIGAWLHAINWRELGNEDAARQNMYVVYGTIAFGILSTLLYFFAAIEIPIMGWSIALGWFFSIGKNQIDFLRREAGNDYMRKKWGKVVMWIIFGMLAYVFVYYFALYFLYTSGSLHPSVMEFIRKMLEEAARGAAAQP